MSSSTESSGVTDSTTSILRTPSESDNETSLSSNSSIPPAGNKDESNKESTQQPQEDFRWVTGNREYLVHVRKIGLGTTGAVHEVSLILSKREADCIVEKY